MYTIITHKINTEKNLNSNQALRHLNVLAWKIIINGWETFVRTSHKQNKWILEVLNTVGRYKFQTADCSEELKFHSESINMNNFSPVIYFYLKFSHYPNFMIPEFPLKDYCIENVKNSDSSSNNNDPANINNIHKRCSTVKVKEECLIEPMGRLLIEDLSFL